MKHFINWMFSISMLFMFLAIVAVGVVGFTDSDNAKIATFIFTGIGVFSGILMTIGVVLDLD